MVFLYEMKLYTERRKQNFSEYIENLIILYKCLYLDYYITIKYYFNRKKKLKYKIRYTKTNKIFMLHIKQHISYTDKKEYQQKLHNKLVVQIESTLNSSKI